jgi:hypothetical protein
MKVQLNTKFARPAEVGEIVAHYGVPFEFTDLGSFVAEIADEDEALAMIETGRVTEYITPEEVSKDITQNTKTTEQDSSEKQSKASKEPAEPEVK